MKNRYLLITLMSGLVLLLSACSEGEKGTSVGSSDLTPIIVTQIDITDCETSIPLLTGDTVVKETDGTSVKIIDLSSSKTICVLTGAAHILR